VPAVLGWKGHEDQWRDGNCVPCAGRFEDVTALYSSRNMADAERVVNKYGVSYIYVGDFERQQYGASGGLEKFRSLPVAFQSGTVTIYSSAQLRGAQPQAAAAESRAE
jgi:uncharacterized membrane protein